eukprot:TRINITY_DN11097_c0_g1_i2.p1 TRINITY_DN11097_c0_g1~~TRINITY_DN11097_c0_g1_i2.p1  ORF type:complete len:568 (+),score=146.83 TRINITY_DN11097_c0_g1_i2:14-1717(+)
MTRSVTLCSRFEACLLEDPDLDRQHLRRRGEYSGNEALRPGFVRFNLTWFQTSQQVSQLVTAVKFVAEHGWKFLMKYKLNAESGEWLHHDDVRNKARQWLSHYSIHGPESAPDQDEPALSFEEALQQAHVLAEAAQKTIEKGMLAPSVGNRLTPAAEALRWFVYPDEVGSDIQHLTASIKPNAGVSETPSTTTDWRWLISPPRQPMSALEMHSQQLLQMKARAQVLQLKAAAMQESRGSLLQTIRSASVGLDVTQPAETDSPATKDKFEASSSNGDKETEAELAFDITFDAVQAAACALRRKLETTTVASTAAWRHPPKTVLKPTLKALEHFDMLRDGDRVLVCVSGGKDSLSLLHTLKQVQYMYVKRGVRFDLAAATVDPGQASYDPSPLKAYMQALDVPYFFEEQCIMDDASNIKDLASICSFCARMKRGRLYACARREGYNVLMFGQHLDDLAESMMMSMFHNGYLKTMKAHYTVEDGDLRLARPFVFVREKHLRAFAEDPKVRLPVISENCPACFDEPTERHRMKQLLAAQELLYPNIFQSLQAAMMPLMEKDKTGIETNKRK